MVQVTDTMCIAKLKKMRSSLAFRLTLWYAAVFALSSCLVFLFFYLLIIAVIGEGTDRELKEQAGKFSRLLSARGIGAVKELTLLEAQAAGERKIFFRLLSLRGETFSSSNMSYWQDIGISSGAVRELLSGSSHVFDSRILPDRRHRIRVLYTNLGRGIILQLGQSMENLSRFMEAFRKIFFLTMPFLIIPAAITGWFMARKALSGLGEVTRTARSVSAKDLKGRVPLKKWGSEIEELAETFNRMLDRMEQLVTGMKEMSDNIAHDLKSPVTRIRGMAEIALTTDSAREDFQEMSADIIAECDRLLEMIHTMLLISRSEAGLGVYTFADTDLAEIIREAGELFLVPAEDKKIRLKTETPEHCGFRGDTKMLQRLFANLLDNAIRHTSEGGEVKISLIEKEAEICISVRDTGSGIPPEHLPHIFKRFYRADPSRSGGQGAGLGLSLARAVAEAHGGKMDAESGLGKGSVFRVRLPASPEKLFVSCDN
jgi:heavy metal sensor kinase